MIVLRASDYLEINVRSYNSFLIVFKIFCLLASTQHKYCDIFPPKINIIVFRIERRRGIE